MAKFAGMTVHVPRRNVASAGHAKRCPTCKRPWPGEVVRVCVQCGKPIDRRHKYILKAAGRRRFTFEHRDCNDPIAYEPWRMAEAKMAIGDAQRPRKIRSRRQVVTKSNLTRRRR